MKTIHLSLIGSFCIATAIGVFIIWFFTSSYDFSTYTKDNSLGIEANVIYDYNPNLMCNFLPCHTSKTFQLNFTSKEGSELISYNICDGIFCTKKAGFENHIINAGAQNHEIAFGSVTSYKAGPIILGDLPWTVGDTVDIRMKVMPVTVLDNGSLIHYPERTMFVDLGKSKIIEVGNQTK
ncbi:MAG: hypothetical protein ACREA7_08660 [Nitrosotalea sp.]